MSSKLLSAKVHRTAASAVRCPSAARPSGAWFSSTTPSNLLVKRARAFHLSDKTLKSDSELYNEAKRSVRSMQKGVFFGTSAATYLSRSSSRSLSTTAAAVASSSALLQSSAKPGKKSSRLASGERCAPHERLLVLGSGVAGCAAALTAARHGVPVTVLHAGSAKEDCNSYWAQGGVIYRNYRLREKEDR